MKAEKGKKKYRNDSQFPKTKLLIEKLFLLAKTKIALYNKMSNNNISKLDTDTIKEIIKRTIIKDRLELVFENKIKTLYGKPIHIFVSRSKILVPETSLEDIGTELKNRGLKIFFDITFGQEIDESIMKGVGRSSVVVALVNNDYLTKLKKNIGRTKSQLNFATAYEKPIIPIKLYDKEISIDKYIYKYYPEFFEKLKKSPYFKVNNTNKIVDYIIEEYKKIQKQDNFAGLSLNYDYDYDNNKLILPVWRNQKLVIKLANKIYNLAFKNKKINEQQIKEVIKSLIIEDKN